MNQNITAMTQITFHSIINTALSKANDRGNLKSYIIRQSKIAERDAFYTWDDFSAGLIKDVTGKMESIKFLHKKRLEELQQDIDNIEKISFKDPSGDKNLNDYTSEEREQYQITARNKHLDWTKEELKSLTVYHYKKNEYGKLEIIIDVINEISGRDKANVSDEPKKQGRPKAIIHDVSNYLVNEKLLSFLISKYSEVKPQVFNHLIRVLIDLEQLEPASKKEYKEAFGEALRVKQSQTNFDNSLNMNKNTAIYDPIKREILNFLEGDKT